MKYRMLPAFSMLFIGLALPESARALDLTPRLLMELMGKSKAETLSALAEEKLHCSPFPDGVVVCRSARLSVLFIKDATKSIEWDTKGASADLSPGQFGDMTGCTPWKRPKSIELQGCPKLRADVSIIAEINGPVTAVKLLW